jgi:hypothetical protein
VSNVVQVTTGYSDYSARLRSRFSIVPPVKNIPAAQLLGAEEKKRLMQTLNEIRLYAESRRHTDECAPICFISFVHGQHDAMVEKIADYLEAAGIIVYADIGERHKKYQLDRATYMQKALLEMASWDFVIVLGSPDYLQLYNSLGNNSNKNKLDVLRLDKKAIKSAEKFSKKCEDKN